MRRVAAVLAVGMALGASVAAWGQGFTNYRQAANDQYSQGSGNGNGNGNGPPVTVTTPSGNPPGSNPPGSNPPGKKHKHHQSGSGNNSGTNAPGTGTGANPPGTGANPPVPVPGTSANPPLPKGQLPYTGGALGVLVLIALTSLAAGFLLAAAARLRRARSRGDASAS